MNIPSPSSSGAKDQVDETINCDAYDGDTTTAALCKAYITKTQDCLRFPDRSGGKCDGFGHVEGL
jgi:hypothetical protein